MSFLRPQSLASKEMSFQPETILKIPVTDVRAPKNTESNILGVTFFLWSSLSSKGLSQIEKYSPGCPDEYRVVKQQPPLCLSLTQVLITLALVRLFTPLCVSS